MLFQKVATLRAQPPFEEIRSHVHGGGGGGDGGGGEGDGGGGDGG